ncbi:MAG: hypothetical protein RLZZ450_4083 [Pseudomonadota bacterium]|jgi:hypothetical protein
MQRSSPIWIAFAVAALGAIGCTDEGVGDPCIPETVPCNANGEQCGYKASEAYIEATSVQCKSRLCIVYKLDNNTQGSIPSDPRTLCDSKGQPQGCVDNEALAKSVYCTCRCDTGGVKSGIDTCTCPDGFTCEPVLNLGGPGIVGSYCVNKDSINEE